MCVCTSVIVLLRSSIPWLCGILVLFICVRFRVFFTLERFFALAWGDDSESGRRCLSGEIFLGGKAHSRLGSDAESRFECDDEQFKSLHRDTRSTISICFGSG